MAYLDNEHKAKVNIFNAMWRSLDGLEELATQYDINDITQDTNLKLLQILILFDLDKLPGREGADARDRYGNDWELKTVNLRLTKSFSTNHHTTFDIINAFRRERWLFSVYEGITLKEVYAVSAEALEPHFSKWEQQIQTRIDTGASNQHLNNPKIPLKFVREVGVQVFPVSDPPIDPADALR